MGKVLIIKEDKATSPLQTQLMMGGGGAGGMGGGMFLTPERPITPHDAGVQAAMNSMGGSSYSPEQTNAIAGNASRAAQMAGKYGGLAAMFGSGLKNIYDSSVSGQAPSLTGMATSAYGANQFMKPLATRAGAQYGAQRGLNRVGRAQGDIDRENQEGMADYNQGGQGESNLVRNPILPRTGQGVASQATEQLRAGATPASIGRAGLDVSYSQKPEFQGFGNLFDGAEQELRDRQGRTKAGSIQPGNAYSGPGSYGPQIAPPNPMSAGRANNVLAGRTREPLDDSWYKNRPFTPTSGNSRQATLGDNQPGMSEKINSALPDPMEESKRIAAENAEKEEEKKNKLAEDQRNKLAEDINRQNNLSGFGA